MKKVLFALSFLVILGLQSVLAQTTNVTGTVTDATDGSPIPGVSVFVKGTTIGTVTTPDGTYTLSVPNDAPAVVFSFVGMTTQEIAYTGQTVINAAMQSDAVDVDEVIVVAYGTAKKSSFTGSASNVKTEKILSSKTESVDKALAGKVSGVRVASTTGDPGASGEIQIRGIGSISGSTQPLYVIDGVPVTTGDFGARVSSNILSTINPDDIESMTILKDAAAASLYGSRAANGVVIITTKKGKSGDTRFNLKVSQGWSEMATDSYKMMSGVDYAQYHKAALEGYYLQGEKALVPGQPNYGDATIQADAKAWAESKYMDPSWSYVSEERNGADWRDIIYDGGSDQDYQFSASGGNEKTDFYASVGIKKVEGIVRNRNFDRYSTTLNVNNKARKWLDLSFKTQLSYTEQEGRGDQSDQGQGISTASPLSMLYSSNPTMDAYNEDGTLNMDASFNARVQNPIHALSPKEASVTNKTYRALNNIAAKVQILPELSFKSTNSVDYVSVKSFNYWGPNSIDGASLNGLGEKQDNEVITMTSTNMFNYMKTFNEVHNVNGLLGFEVQDYKNNYVFASASDYSTDKLPELGNAQPREVSSGFYNRFMISYIGNVNYNYADKYYLAASVRSDESSQLGADNRQGTFYSGSASWRFSQEDFFKNEIITDGKVRFSYGTNGALPTGSYSHLGLYYFGGAYGGAPAIYLDQVANNDLGWEKSQNINLGLDLTFFQRFTFTAEYFNKYTKDLLLNVPASYLTGVSSSLQNYGEISNSGLEFEFHGQDVLKSQVRWDVDLSLATLKAKVEKLPGGEDIILGDGNLYLYRENEDLYTFYLPTYVGVDPQSGLGQFLIDPSKPATDDNMTYVYSEAGRGPQGASYPTISGGFSNTFTWKGISLNVLMTYQFGGQLFDYPGYFSHHDGVRNFSFNLHEDVAGNYWQKPGDVVDNPRPVIGSSLRSDRWSTRHLHSTDHIRLKEVSLNYNLPKDWYQKIGVDNVSVSFNVNNLAYLYAATKDMELEVSLNGYRTVDTPLARTYSFGVNVGF
ncbi:TonB-dependent receptor [Carboxylicivirga sediminis]|uniref:TonB-dependent receptor n=1 Tax=Carboxylicivirga sediminis TaxID=2006564 RepID=A0A941IZ90_9BACT|nr:TonB-dependent receptor [Carboxylicivirga sediminis]MBR8537209.1 TonB-dependent receptor [Carboxylicivirga sediminis]